MSYDARWPLQVAVAGRLRAALAGAAADGGPVEVWSSAPARAPALYVRIDGFAVSPRLQAQGRDSLHTFMLHTFASEGAAGADPRAEAIRVHGLAVAALEDWQPIEGATAVDHVSASDAPDQNPAVHHAVSRFRTYAGG